MGAPRACDAVLLVGFGGPTRQEEVRPFLQNVLRGRAVPRDRFEEVVRHYDRIGGRSPYNELTMRQADALRARLRNDGIEVPVAVGMRNWAPYISDSMRELASRGAHRVLAFVLAAHRCEASWDRYQQSVRESLEALGANAPAAFYPLAWHAHPKFIQAVSERTRDAIAGFPADDRGRPHLVFSAHSIPQAMAAASDYVEEITESSRLVARQLGLANWTLAFQSRSGNPREPWLEPELGTALRSLGGSTIVIVPIGFLCDHVEVSYDLDVEAAQIARDAGIMMRRAATVGDHPAFIEMIAAMVRGTV